MENSTANVQPLHGLQTPEERVKLRSKVWRLEELFAELEALYMGATDGDKEDEDRLLEFISTAGDSVLGELVDYRREAEAIEKELKEAADQANKARRRAKSRADWAKRTMLRIMQVSGKRNVDVGNYAITRRAGATYARPTRDVTDTVLEELRARGLCSITPERFVPEQFVPEQVEPNTTAILERLKANEDVPAYEIGHQAETVMVR